MEKYDVFIKNLAQIYDLFHDVEDYDKPTTEIKRKGSVSKFTWKDSR